MTDGAFRVTLRSRPRNGHQARIKSSAKTICDRGSAASGLTICWTAPPSGRGTPRLVSTEGTGRCPSCGHAVGLRLDGKTIAHKTSAGHCPGGGQPPAEDAPLACWLPVKDRLTPHGLRHSHKTWMAEDGIPEILAEQRLGHQVPGMRGLYAHASERMRDELTAILQARWEESLRERAALDPYSPVPLLDSLLAPLRDCVATMTVSAGGPGLSPAFCLARNR